MTQITNSVKLIELQASLDLLHSSEEQKLQILSKLRTIEKLLFLMKFLVRISRPATLFNCCLQAGNFPTPQKFGEAVMIPTPEKGSLCAEGYCPIILLPTAGKVVQRVIGAQLHTHVVEKVFYMIANMAWCNGTEKFISLKSTSKIVPNITIKHISPR